MSTQRGFTLIELMLTLIMTALIAVAGYGALSGVMQTRQIYEEKAAELAQLQRFLTVISRDIRLASDMLNRGADGDFEDVLIVTKDVETLLVFNRRGWHNPLMAPRSELQRVYYRFDGETVVRGHWEAFDRVDDTPFRERVLLEGVRAIGFQALPDEEASNLDRAWVEEWPIGSAGLPAAIELTLELESLGEFKRIYELQPQG
jgi:general secretion pathway protein J